MELKLASPEQVAMVYQRDLKPSFPPSELKPLANIQAMCRDGCYQPWCLFDGEEIAGECFLWLGRPGWALLDYLCVVPSRRNDGLGREMQKALRAEEPAGTVIFGEAEAPAFAPDPAMAERRLGFYHRCGWRDAGYDSDIFSARYRCIYLADREVSPEELMDQHRYVYRTGMSPKQCRRFIRIPWDPNYQTPRR